MAIRNKYVAEAFLNRMRLSTTNLFSTINKLFSYNTCIAQWLDDGTLLGNATKYSSTTSRHLRLIKCRINKWTKKEVPLNADSLIKYM